MTVRQIRQLTTDQSTSMGNLLEELRNTKKQLNGSSEAITIAHAVFTSQYNTFLALAEQIEVKFKELDDREAALKIWEKEVKERDTIVEEREKKCKESEAKVEARDKEVVAKETKWKEIEKRMEENAAKLPHVLHFNISGTRFSVLKEKILKYKGSLFENMIVTDHQQLTPGGEIFIERDPTYFSHVSRFLSSGTLQLPTKPSEALAIWEEFKYFRIQIVMSDCRFVNQINEWLPNKRFTLIYKGSVDGFSPTSFHEHCDRKGPTLTVIKSGEGYLFGGYAPCEWMCDGEHSHPEAFIFTFTNPHDIPPTKYSLKPGYRCAIYAYSRYGPTFGYVINNGHDILSSNLSGYFDFPQSYIDTTKRGNRTFTGAQKFTIKEIETFSVM